MKTRTLFIFCFTFIFSISLLAADKKLKSKKTKTPKTVPKQEQVLTIPIPQSHLDLQALYFPEEKKSKARFDVQASTWSPKSLKDDLYFKSNSTYQTNSISKLSIQYVGASFAEWKSLSFKPCFGFSFAQATQSIDLVFHDNVSRVEENLNFYALKLGLESTFTEKFWGTFEPIVRLNYLPMWTQAASTEINAGIDRTSSVLEYSLGVAISSAKISHSLGLEDVAFQLGYEKTTGLRGIPFEGSGFIFGTRIQL